MPEVGRTQVDSLVGAVVPLQAASSTVAPQIAEPANSPVGEPPRQTPTQFWVSASPYIVDFYLVGVLLMMMMRLAIAFGGGERLRRSSLPIEESQVLEALRSKAAELGLRAAPAGNHAMRLQKRGFSKGFSAVSGNVPRAVPAIRPTARN